MPNYRRARHDSTYFFTLVARDRQPVLCEQVVRLLLRQSIEKLRVKRPFRIDAWVLLPDHLHCIWTLPDSDTDYSARWGWLKKEVTKGLRATGKLSETRKTSLWQPRFWEHMIRDSADLTEHCDYVHFNPVRHGLVKNVGEWPYSTFHRFLAKGVYDEKWGSGTIHIPRDVGKE